MKTKDKEEVWLEVVENLANILFQDMNFHNPHEIVVAARTYLLDIGITLHKKK